jgi:hypothetical protein
MNAALANRRFRFGRRLFTGTVTWLSLWLIGGLVLAPVVSTLLAQVFEIGLWTIVATVFQWSAASIAGTMLFTKLPVWISRGCTRREITAAYAVFGALTTLGLAAYLTAGFVLEHAAMSIAGEPPTGLGEAVGAGVRYLVITPIYFITGTLIAALATRFNGDNRFSAAVLFGTGGLYALTLYLEFNGAWFDPGWNTVTWVAAALALGAALVAASAAVLRSVPIRAKQA